MVIHHECILAGLGIAENSCKGVLDEGGGLSDGVGSVGELGHSGSTLAVT